MQKATDFYKLRQAYSEIQLVRLKITLLVLPKC
jgi:hypothetical protein